VRDKLIPYIRSGHAGLFLVSHEESRVEAELKAVAESVGYGLFAWSVTEGMVKTEDGARQTASDPLQAIEMFVEKPERVLVLLRDFHAFLDDANPVLVRALKDALRHGRAHNKVAVIVGCRQNLPPELEREFVVLDFALPDHETLGRVLDGIAQSAELETPQNDQRLKLLDAASGLTCLEAENAFALSVAQSKTIQPDIVSQEKAQALKKNGLLEVCESVTGLDQIGGLDVLKDWLLKRRDAFSRRAIEYGLPSPKGLLIVGVPGTGKSLTAKATSSVFERPLLKLDAGRIFGSLVGQSEANFRDIVRTAEAIAPCVLWIEEIEKAMAGSKSSGSTDGGTSSRVFGSFLSWLQEKTAPVFVVATANDVTQLPPELLRRGRFDDIFFVDLPNQEEREAIWTIQIARHRRDPAKYSIPALSKGTEGYTGAEIEQIVVDGLYDGFANNIEPTTVSMARITTESVPLSRLMAESVKALRQWAQGRARCATSPEHQEGGRRKLAA
jgi:MoxR-like ATPase